MADSQPPAHLTPTGPRAEDPDQALVARAVAGEMRAFELLVRKYQPRVQRLIGRWVRDSARCEDVAQDVFMSVYRALPNFRRAVLYLVVPYRCECGKKISDAHGERTRSVPVRFDTGWG